MFAAQATDLPVAHVKKQIPLIPVEKMYGTVPNGAGLGKIPELVTKSGGSKIVIAEPTRSHHYHQGKQVPFVIDLMTIVTATPLATVTRSYTPGRADAIIPMVFAFSFDIPHGVSGAPEPYSRRSGVDNPFVINLNFGRMTKSGYRY